MAVVLMVTSPVVVHPVRPLSKPGLVRRLLGQVCPLVLAAQKIAKMPVSNRDLKEGGWFIIIVFVKKVKCKCSGTDAFFRDCFYQYFFFGQNLDQQVKGKFGSSRLFLFR